MLDAIKIDFAYILFYTNFQFKKSFKFFLQRYLKMLVVLKVAVVLPLCQGTRGKSIIINQPIQSQEKRKQMTHIQAWLFFVKNRWSNQNQHLCEWFRLHLNQFLFFASIASLMKSLSSAQKTTRFISFYLLK